MSVFVLVHGAWVGGWCYKRVAQHLRQEGHVVYTPTCTGLGERSHLFCPDLDLETHVTDVMNVIKYEELDDFVLVGHSWGGMVVTAVADRIPERVARLVYVDGFVPNDGKSMFDYLPPALVGALYMAAARWNNAIPPLPLDAVTSTEDDMRLCTGLTGPHPLHSLDQPVHLCGGLARLRTKRVFVWNERFAGSPFKQFYDALVSDPSWMTVRTPCGHMIMLTKPEELVRILLDVC